MEMKQKRGWLRFALTTAIALAFMLSLSVTAMARGITLVPVDSNEHQLVVDMVVDAGTEGLIDLDVRLEWDESVLSLVTPVVVFPNSANPAEEWVELNMQPPASAIARGNIRLVFLASEHNLADPETPLENQTGEAAWVRLRFNLAADAAIAVGDTTDIFVTFTGAAHQDGSTRVAQTIYPMPRVGFTGLRVIWGVYGNTTNMQFVTDITGTHAAWWQFWYQAWIHSGSPTGEDAVDIVNANIAWWADPPAA